MKIKKQEIKYEWLLNPENVIYTDLDTVVKYFSRNWEVADVYSELTSFEENPVKEGVCLKAGNAKCLLMFVPELYFGEYGKRLVMGNKIWICAGESEQCIRAYCIC